MEFTFGKVTPTKALKTKLQTAQNKLIGLLLNLPSRPLLTANHNIMLSVGWLLVADRVQFLAMGLVYKIHYTTKIPMYLSRYFQNVKDVHHHNTRGSSTNHIQPSFSSKFVRILYHQLVELPNDSHKGEQIPCPLSSLP